MMSPYRYQPSDGARGRSDKDANLERETGIEAPSTNQCVEFDYRLGN